MREHFHYFAHGRLDAVPALGCYAVLDTSVLSAVSSMALKGYNPTNIQHVRAANLCRWLLDNNVEMVSVDFALVEGSGFHSGGINYYTLLRRYVPIEAVRCLSKRDLERLIDSRQPGDIAADATLGQYLQQNLDDVQASLPAIFGPSYLASLAIRRGVRDGMAGAALLGLVTSLLEELNLVPAIPWLAAALVGYGNASTRSRLLQELFKAQDSQLRKSVLSSAWDLAYLQALSLLDGQVKSQSSPQQAAVLVTDDDALYQLARTLKSAGPAFEEPDSSLLRREGVDELRDSAASLRRRRLRSTPTWPTAEGVEALCKPLETALGLPHLKLRVESEPTRTTIYPATLMAIASAAKWDGEKLLDALERLPAQGDLLWHAANLARLAVMDNARQRNRSPLESAAAISTRLRSRTGLTSRPLVGEQLLWAMVRDDEVEATALLYEVEVVNASAYGSALMAVCATLRECWLDTSEAHNVTLDELVEGVRGRLGGLLGGSVDASGPPS